MSSLNKDFTKIFNSLRADWLDLPTELRFPIIIAAVGEFALKVSVWVSLSRRKARFVNGPKWMWATLTAINGIGPAAYWLFGRKK